MKTFGKRSPPQPIYPSFGMDVQSMDELALYGFHHVKAAKHYNPKHKIEAFYKKAFKQPYGNKSLRDIEKYRNMKDEDEIQRIHTRLAKAGRKVEKKGKEKLKKSSFATNADPMIKDRYTSSFVQERKGWIGQYAMLKTPG